MIVVDTNILAHLYFPTVHVDWIEKLQIKHPDWIVPSLWKSEFINVATAYYRKGLISFDDALIFIEEASKSFEDFEIDADVRIIMRFVRESKCSSYDSQYIALADQLNVRLVTYDKQLLQQFPDIAIKPEDYLALSK